ncbi:MAG: TonB-dependent receptor [Paludibacteraceae bacterium]|nr:TonB-dependent receptor [Paludibacteraceae bacterium]
MKEKASKLMSLRRSVFMLLLFVFSALPLFAQQKEISGVVKDEKGETVIGASVKVKGTDIGTVSDINGVFTLKDLPADKQTLEISYVGMDPQEVTIKGDKVDVTMKEKSKELDAVVVTGYGSTKKRDLVTSISSVSAEDLKNVPVTSAAEALEGKLSGVTVTQTEGSPDAAMKIRVRGGGSLTQNAEPLYIVDGFPVSDISNISPTDIQSVDVLKDASATAIYGAQGANGVIIITTKDATPDKDGKSKISVDYTGYIGWKKVTKSLDVLSAADYVKLCYEKAYMMNMKTAGAYGGNFITNGGFDETMATNFYNYFGYKGHNNGTAYPDAFTSLNSNLKDLTNYVSASVPSTDWQDQTFGRTGFVSNHSITISGGSKTANFNASYNNVYDKAILVGSDYRRDNLALKATFSPLQPLKLGFSTRYSDTRVNGSGTNSVNDAGSNSVSRLRNCIAYTPIALLTQITGESDDASSLGNLYNPLRSIADNYQYKQDTRFNISGFASYEFMKGLTGRSEVGFESDNVNTNRYYGLTSYYANNNQIVGTLGGTAAIINTKDQKTKFRNANTVTYEKRINKKHNLSAMVGEEMIINKEELYTLDGFGYDSTYTGQDCFKHFSQGSGYLTSNYIEPKDNQLSFFGRGNYDYKGRYYVTGTLRADGSTRFAKGNQWGLFPSLAGAWRASDEEFMKGFKEKTTLSNLKVRLSYGMAGNNNVDLGALQQPYYSFVSTSILTGTQNVLESKNPDNGNILGNENLKWETTITRDFGFDYGFLKDRITGAFDIYWNNTKNLIVMYKLPYGYDYEYRNVGSTTNKGAEASIKAVILDKRTKTQNYGLDFSFNINANVTRIKDLGGLDTIYAGTNCFSNENMNNGSEYIVTVGGKTGDIFGYKVDGYYTANDFTAYNTSDGTWTLKSGVPVMNVFGTASTALAAPGMIKFKDLNGDGILDSKDRTVIGNTQPLFTGGFSLNGHYGNFDISANFNYSYGNDVLNMNKIESTTLTDKSYMRNCTAEVASGSRYTLFTDDGVYLPAKYSGSDLINQLNSLNAGASIWSPIMPGYVVSDWAVEDGSFLRFSSLTVGYTMPSKIIRKLKIQKLRFFVTASNLWLWTNYSGFDPEVDTRSSSNPLTTGVDYSAYPKSKGFNVGLNLSF